MTNQTEHLIAEATTARLNASAPYSKFRVGAALLTTEGQVFRGCNVENASYGLTVCAERVALLTAIANGHRSFQAIAVVTDAENPATPCGPCRQLLWEYAGDMEVVIANLTGSLQRYTMSQLLPFPFTLIPEA